MIKQLMTLVVVVSLTWQTSVCVGQGNAVTDLPKGWHLLDKEKDGFYGISLSQAYEFLKGKKSHPVIVGIIDTGVDTLHEDLKEVLWRNPREIPKNGIDDDKNGYVDDIHGWNFLGGKDGRNVREDSHEAARIYHKLKPVYGKNNIDTLSLSPEKKEQYQVWLKVKSTIEGDAASGGVDYIILQRLLKTSISSDSILRNSVGATYTGNDLEKFAPANPAEQKAKAIMLNVFHAFALMDKPNNEFLVELKETIESEQKKKEALDKVPPDYRGEIVKDDESNIEDRYYGNNDVMAGSPDHGTHVAGIIAAKRSNGKGMDGIADNVRIMAIRAVANGDEHDKDVALSIRYAVDNGAKVVNMSFGKGFSPEKQWVDDAVKYAESKGVLLIHAAGNEAQNVDTTENFPNPNLKGSKTRATNWITVGASSDPLAEKSSKSYTAYFSNYGKKEVDIFAPGTKIYSSLPGGNIYSSLQGTSMAAPVVAGVAALIYSYYPDLSPAQVKYAIEKSAVHLPVKVKNPGSADVVDFSDISTSGGILNAYGAVKLASQLKPEKTVNQKSTFRNKKG